MFLTRRNGHQQTEYADTLPPLRPGDRVTVQQRGGCEHYPIEVRWAHPLVLEDINGRRWPAAELTELWLYW